MTAVLVVMHSFGLPRACTPAISKHRLLASTGVQEYHATPLQGQFIFIDVCLKLILFCLKADGYLYAEHHSWVAETPDKEGRIPALGLHQRLERTLAVTRPSGNVVFYIVTLHHHLNVQACMGPCSAQEAWNAASFQVLTAA